MSEKPRPVIVIVSDFDMGKTFPLTKNVHFCGRSINNDIHLEDKSVSSLHCKFAKTGSGTYMVIDLESTNGIVLGGKLVPYAELKNGDIFNLGNTQMLYSDEPGSVNVIENTYVETYFVKDIPKKTNTAG